MKIWQEIQNLLLQNKNLIFLKVVWHLGSSPGKQGFQMIVSEDGDLLGSIGGGRTEFQLVEEAKLMLLNSESKPIFRKQVHREQDENSSGMICAGEQWVVLFPLDHSHKTLVDSILQNRNTSFTLTSNTFLWNKEILDVPFIFDFKSEKHWSYSENINQKERLYLVGGGHVGLATAKIFQDLDFEVTMLDNRQSLNTFEQNTYSDFKKVIDFEEINKHIIESQQTYIVILTHNFQSDSQIIMALQSLKVKYIGVLGSKSKIKSMFKEMGKNSVDKAFLHTLDAPIGIPINSITPAEIAISIAAKVISIKNKATF
jgi:xanthine dehydrogenase accessory factor